MLCKNKPLLLFYFLGASSGIGAETAVEFARAGASVVLVARRTEELNKIAEKCQEAGARKEQVTHEK